MGARILLIDDEPNLVLALGTYLRQAGYGVVTAAGGKEGLEKLRYWRPDLILCDVMMPGMDGLDVRQALEGNPRHRNIPFIFLTAKSQLDDRLLGLHSGADDYIAKPFEPKELVARIESLLRRVTRDRAAAVQEVEALKENILANVTHELRTPVAVMRNTLELSLEGAFGSDVQLERRFLAQALENARNLQRLIDDLLLMAALDNDDMQLFLEPISVAGLLRGVQTNLWRVKAADWLVIDPPEPSDLTLCADRRHVQAVLSHLVDNALKFSSGTSVEVRAEARDDGVAISVTDRGEGIAAEHLPFIFDRFFQADMSSTRAYDGLGCGLYLVRALVEAHGGKVDVESQVGEGSRFTVWLPLGLPEGLQQVTELYRAKDHRQGGS
jgi:two-component system sensor histidine kinase/response regulator